jgi:2-keto-4-pentenoate hydratase/2-oxohepta-3-ene-1,7-dioic acid hydratase in catechol pathway
MKWLRFEQAGRARLGRLDGDTVLVHEGDLFGDPQATGERLPAASIRWLTPCVPRTMVALWNNFAAAAAKNGWTRPAEPLWFLKAAGCLAAHGQAIASPRADVGRIAYEGELAIVIGRTTRAVSVADAPSHVFGYSCANDVTAIELLNRDPSFAQWSRAKSFDGFGAFGPVIETDFDWATGCVRTLVVGRERQNYPLSDMFFSPAEIVSAVSQDLTLEAGDLILCGTSLGVLPMKPGTTVEVVIDGIGTLSNAFG